MPYCPPLSSTIRFCILSIQYSNSLMSSALGPKKEIDWPDFYHEAIELKGKPASESDRINLRFKNQLDR
jgi:hypothetical protein